MNTLTVKKDKILQRYFELSNLYRDSIEYRRILTKVDECILHGRLLEAMQIMDGFKTKKDLLEELFNKLKGKPVYDTLRKINKYGGSSIPISMKLKAYFSLGTHASIEYEKGRKEYKVILKDIVRKLGVLLWG